KKYINLTNVQLFDLGLGGNLPQVAQMPNGELAKFEEEHHIALWRSIIAPAVIGGSPCNKDILNLILTRTANDLWLTCHTIGAVVSRLVMADGEDVGAQLGQLQPYSTVIGVANNGYTPLANAETR